MNANAPNPYLRTKILTASPQELRLMLYDGALRFCQQALPALEKKDFETSFNALMRAQKIVLELSTSLKHTIAPELCEKLGALYNFIYRKLVDATTLRDPKPLAEAIDLLTYERDTWRLLMKQMGNGVGDDLGAAQQTAMSSLTSRVG